MQVAAHDPRIRGPVSQRTIIAGTSPHGPKSVSAVEGQGSGIFRGNLQGHIFDTKVFQLA